MAAETILYTTNWLMVCSCNCISYSFKPLNIVYNILYIVFGATFEDLMLYF